MARPMVVIIVVVVVVLLVFRLIFKLAPPDRCKWRPPIGLVIGGQISVNWTRKEN